MVEKFTTGNITILKPDNDFEMVPGAIIRNNPSVTIGVYCKLLSFGENWKLNVKGLATTLEISQNVVRKVLSQLELQGFLSRTPHYIGGKLRGWDYVVYGNCLPEDERKHPALRKISTTENSVLSKISNTENREGNINILESNIHTYSGNTHTKDRVHRFVAPSVYEVEIYCHEAGLTAMTAQDFCDYYESCGWKVGRNAMKDWKAAARSWNGREIRRAEERRTASRPKTAIETTIDTMLNWK